ncbi:MAG: M23 family metallopeptidase [Rhodospirillaceae bacterium]
MQVMWLSSPLGKMHAVSITKRNVLLAVGACAALCVMLGMLLYFVGFRMAVQLRPDLVRAVGGVMTAGDVEQRDAEHRNKLAQLQQQLADAQQQLQQLQVLKDSFMQMALPKGQSAPTAPAEGKAKLGMGGPRRSAILSEPYQPASDAAGRVADYMDVAQEQFERLNASLTRLQSEWQQQLAWLEYVPTGQPIAGKPSFASRFGMRLDPFTRTPARHDGIDFNAAPGTPILASASGVVVRVAHDPQYGKMVDVDHRNGYMTRYAHADAVYVKEGQRVKRGMAIAAVGSTGRSTGPHLHYEVHRNGPLNPERFLARTE